MTQPEQNDLEDQLLGSVLAERFRVTRRLGSGGMGAVYLAEHVHMRKEVAIKVLHASMTGVEEIVARFEREAIAGARIAHPHVASAFDFGKLEDGRHYLALEYVAGESLRDLIARGPVPLVRALTIAQQIADGLAQAHAVDVVHRDMKPDNVMLVEKDGLRDFVKILDFGIAKVTLEEDAAPSLGGAALTRVGTVFGTPGYMAPEQALGQPVDARADVYAIGVILYEMLAGHLPFAGAELAQQLAKQLTEPPTPLPASIPTAVRDLIDRMLERERDARLGSAAQVAAEISEILDQPELHGAAASEPATAAVTGYARLVQSVTRPMRARRVWVMAGGLGMFALLVGALFWPKATKHSSAPEPARVAPSGAPPLASLGPQLSAAPSSGASVAPAPSVPGSAAGAASAMAPAAGSAPASSASASASAKPKTATRSAKSGRAPAKKQKRRTGPGGIYIPPPSEWF